LQAKSNQAEEDVRKKQQDMDEHLARINELKKQQSAL
jgi:hypothetical protein